MRSRVGFGYLAALFTVIAMAAPAAAVRGANSAPTTGGVQPTLTVTPADGLADRQIVTVTGSGFEPVTGVGIIECKADVDPTWCQQDPSFFGGVQLDRDGHFSTRREVRRMVNVGDPSKRGVTLVDCQTVAAGCAWMALQLAGDAWKGLPAAAPITFDPNASPPPPLSVTVTPNTGVVDGQSVQVTGEGWPPGGRDFVVECIEGATQPDDCDTGLAIQPTVDGSGHASATYTVAQALHVRARPSVVDCAAAAGTCILGLADLWAMGWEGAGVALTFDTSTGDAESSTELASTGVNTIDFGLVGIALVAIGSLTVLATRRRRRVGTDVTHRARSADLHPS